jgi:hypothetical protein
MGRDRRAIPLHALKSLDQRKRSREFDNNRRSISRPGAPQCFNSSGCAALSIDASLPPTKVELFGSLFTKLSFRACASCKMFNTRNFRFLIDMKKSLCNYRGS